MQERRLECRQLVKTYGTGPLAQTVLDGVSFTLSPREKCAIVGPSGSGKTTLLSILGCMLSPSAGDVKVGGESIRYEAPAELVERRRRSIGFVFQQAQLLPFLTLYDNLRLIALNCGLSRAEVKTRIDEVSRQLGIGGILEKKPAQVSGGQRQRTAIARAVLHRPLLLLADEPTAALDWDNGEAAIRLLVEQASLDESILIVVTHDTRLLPHFDRVLHIDRGKVFQQ